MSDLCKNCDTPVSGKYCCNCGQSFTTGRINYHYVIHEVQHSIFHVDKGILYTIKELLTEPGDSIRGYLSGKRISFFKPFSFVIILGSIYAFLCYFFGVRPDTSIMPVDQSEMTVYHTQLIIDWVYAHYSFALLALIPFFALGSYLVFRKSGYNYIELLVIWSYITGIQVLINIAAFFVYYFILSEWVIIFTTLISSLYTCWTFIQLFNKMSCFVVIVKILLSTIIGGIIVLTLGIVGGIIIALWS